MRIGGDTRALVTGASRGIGLATARALRARGATVGVVARGEPDLGERAEEIGATPLPADVADSGAVEAAVDKFAEEAGGIDLLVANAGLPATRPSPSSRSPRSRRW